MIGRILTRANKPLSRRAGRAGKNSGRSWGESTAFTAIAIFLFLSTAGSIRERIILRPCGREILPGNQLAQLDSLGAVFAFRFGEVSQLAKLGVARPQELIDWHLKRAFQVTAQGRPEIGGRQVVIAMRAAFRFGDYFIDYTQLFQIVRGQLEGFGRFCGVFAIFQRMAEHASGLMTE